MTRRQVFAEPNARIAVSFYVSPSMFAKLREAAEENHMAISEYIRTALKPHLDRRAKLVRQRSLIE